MVSTDSRKAFDTVNHRTLLQKLAAYGIRRRGHQWFTSYVLKRSQRADIGGTLSDPKPVTTGVPRGHILGPLLFVVFVNDMGSAVTASSLDLYTDDTTIANDIKTVSSSLNSDLAA